MHDFYVDDLLTGADSFEEAYTIKQRFTDALASACMPLRKWKSNDPKLITEPSQSCLDFHNEGDNFNKTLGLSWQTHNDKLWFPIDVPDQLEMTKRGMLSVIAKIFDPLGLLAPSIIQMKMLLQKLWLEGLKWDDKLPREIEIMWAAMINTLN
ncbi:unnamed protein product [Euphydryas editha]|uniref:Uncharacterized protein n=1 Tax=Euphydryas editha TaxID=104508 RepID=A0AAU9VC61_EUPED|nr:unnamed protein product [Euphydryas editha]